MWFLQLLNKIAERFKQLAHKSFHMNENNTVLLLVIPTSIVGQKSHQSEMNLNLALYFQGGQDFPVVLVPV